MHSGHIGSMCELMNNYLVLKQYDSRYGDMVPMIISNCIKRDLLIVSEWQDGLTTDIKHVQYQNSKTSLDRPLLVFKSGDHYEACLYRTGYMVDYKLHALNSLQYESASIRSDDVGACHKSNNESVGNDITCNDLFPAVSAYRIKYKQNFIFLHVNINSFRHKFAPMQTILNDRKVDLLVVSESKLDSTFPDAQFNVAGFCIYRQDYTASSGGLLVYMRSDIAHPHLVQLEINMGGFESMCIEVNNNKSRRVYVCIYKHPSVSDSIFLKYLSQMADKRLTMCPDIVFIGDMNCCPKKSDTIEEFCEIYNLKNLITSPTCHKGRSPTILDIILVSQPKRFSESLNCECPLSDVHNIVGGATKQYAPFQKPRKIYYRSYKNFDDNKFIRDISNVPLHVGEIFDDIDDLSWFTSSLIIDVINEHAPVTSKILKRASVPYMNSKLRKAIYRRNMAQNKFRKYGSTYWEDNRIQRNKVAAIRKASIAKYFSQKCSWHDKSFWSTVSPFMTDKRHRNGNTFMLQENGKIVTDDKLVANIFNDYFCSIASQIGFDDPITTTHDIISKHKDHPSVSKIRGTYSIEANSFDFSYVNEDVVTSKLRSIKINKGPGYDCIPGKLIRLANKVLSPHFTYMLNQCIRLSIFPSNMKNAELSPLYKKEDQLNKVNYRPVSLLTVISKRYESVMFDRVTTLILYLKICCVHFVRNTVVSLHLLKPLMTGKYLSIITKWLGLSSWISRRHLTACPMV